MPGTELKKYDLEGRLVGYDAVIEIGADASRRIIEQIFKSMTSPYPGNLSGDIVQPLKQGIATLSLSVAEQLARDLLFASLDGEYTVKVSFEVPTDVPPGTIVAAREIATITISYNNGQAILRFIARITVRNITNATPKTDRIILDFSQEPSEPALPYTDIQILQAGVLQAYPSFANVLKTVLKQLLPIPLLSLPVNNTEDRRILTNVNVIVTDPLITGRPFPGGQTIPRSRRRVAKQNARYIGTFSQSPALALLLTFGSNIASEEYRERFVTNIVGGNDTAIGLSLDLIFCGILKTLFVERFGQPNRWFCEETGLRYLSKPSSRRKGYGISLNSSPNAHLIELEFKVSSNNVIDVHVHLHSHQRPWHSWWATVDKHISIGLKTLADSSRVEVDRTSIAEATEADVNFDHEMTWTGSLSEANFVPIITNLQETIADELDRVFDLIKDVTDALRIPGLDTINLGVQYADVRVDDVFIDGRVELT